MTLKHYGIVRGTLEAINEVEECEKAHYQIKLKAGDTMYRLVVNVRSESGSEVYATCKFPFNHHLTAEWLKLKPGFTALVGNKPGKSLDYVRDGLFDWRDLRQAPSNARGDDNDVEDELHVHLARALKAPSRYEIFALGNEWNDEANDGRRRAIDKTWDVWRGLHEIHQNQGNAKQSDHGGSNGIFQDGALFVYDHDSHRWAGFFFKFRSQASNTDLNGDEVEAPDTHKTERLAPGIKIVGALVNPFGEDRGKETVTLVNSTEDNVSIEGWKIVDKNQTEELIGDVTLVAGQFWTLILSGDGAQFSNRGGTIAVVDREGRVIDRESYSKLDASYVGHTLTFG